jgi:hypothetical protein
MQTTARERIEIRGATKLIMAYFKGTSKAALLVLLLPDAWTDRPETELPGPKKV